jgi:NAD(P)-dependent dehydrogenase (short-subunit alcohol dehydrogenase family)
MNSSQILKGKHAVVFGAGGAIGSGVAREFASEGADVFLAGRTKSRLDDVARQITSAGGRAHVGVVDASDSLAVERYLDDVVREAGSLDIVFNAVGPLINEYGNAKNVLHVSTEEFMVALHAIVKPGYVAARAAARHMVKQRSGVIMFVTGSPARPHVAGATAIGAAFGALENLTRNLAFDLSPQGVRVVCVRTAAMPDTRTIQQTTEAMAAGLGASPEQAIAMLASLTLLKVSPHVPDTARAAAFLASDRASMMTGTVLNSSAGACSD